MSVQRVGIHWNSTKRTGYDVALMLIEKLTTKGVEICVNDELAGVLNLPDLHVNTFEHCQIMIVLGGDGTILTALDSAIHWNTPILGINLGRRGFLTELEIDQLDDEMIDRVLEGDYRLEERPMMCIEGLDASKYYALNDIVVTRATTSMRTLSLKYEADDSIVDSILGDGLIIATATGSTAYSLSCGGPIVLPGLECFVLTPISPHTLNARPVVLSSKHRIKVRIMDSRTRAQAVLDGRRVIAMTQKNPEIVITRAERKARFVRLVDTNYFTLLHSKLSEWSK